MKTFDITKTPNIFKSKGNIGTKIKKSLENQLITNSVAEVFVCCECLYHTPKFDNLNFHKLTTNCFNFIKIIKQQKENEISTTNI